MSCSSVSRPSYALNQCIFRAYERPRSTGQGQWKLCWVCRFWNTTARFASTFFKLTEALVITGPGLLAVVFHTPWTRHDKLSQLSHISAEFHFTNYSTDLPENQDFKIYTISQETDGKITFEEQKLKKQVSEHWRWNIIIYTLSLHLSYFYFSYLLTKLLWNTQWNL